MGKVCFMCFMLHQVPTYNIKTHLFILSNVPDNIICKVLLILKMQLVLQTGNVLLILPPQSSEHFIIMLFWQENLHLNWFREFIIKHRHIGLFLWALCDYILFHFYTIQDLVLHCFTHDLTSSRAYYICKETLSGMHFLLLM